MLSATTNEPCFEPPDDEVGVVVGARVILASQPRLFIAVTECVAYSTGFSIGIAVRSKDDLRSDPDGVQIGVRFSDGQPARADGPVIGQSGSRPGGRSWNFSYFVWPLPPDGPVTITCKWAARGLHAAGKQLDGTAIRAAGLKSHSVWG